MKRQTPEGALLKLCLDYLAAEHILAFRMNTGVASYGDRKVAFGVKGMADILVFPQIKITAGSSKVITPLPLWLELKTPKGVQSQLQKSFQAQVESEGHMYKIIQSLDELK